MLWSKFGCMLGHITNAGQQQQQKREIEAGTDDVEDLKMLQVAPEGSIGNVMLELPILKKYWEHPYFQVR